VNAGRWSSPNSATSPGQAGSGPQRARIRRSQYSGFLLLLSANHKVIGGFLVNSRKKEKETKKITGGVQAVFSSSSCYFG
jgi:hypothetical protein